MTAKIDIDALSAVVGTRYPAPFDTPCRARERRRLGDAAGLTQFGVNLTRLPPGTWSSQRHWHTSADEFVCVLEGELVLVTDAGREILRPGDYVGFPAGRADGHQLRNEGSADAVILEIGTRGPDDAAHYSDIDMVAPAHETPSVYTRRDGTPYPAGPRTGP
ncbi:MAG: cupin domain-containing protein [Alphaproteobacteria bacterium]|nr:cupin domain-containing protein [Alphaproteobacteria bacterium]